MARRKIREYTAKMLILKHLGNLDSGIKELSCQMITNATNFHYLKLETPEFNESSLVVKPDMLFGKRGKNDLVYVNKSFDECKKWVYERMDKEIKLGAVEGKLTHFLIEKFIPHQDEYYLSFMTDRYGTIVRFSVSGGIEIEENWEKIKTLNIPVNADIQKIEMVCLRFKTTTIFY